jgi:hypothetical protein
VDIKFHANKWRMMQRSHQPPSALASFPLPPPRSAQPVTFHLLLCGSGRVGRQLRHTPSKPLRYYFSSFSLAFLPPLLGTGQVQFHSRSTESGRGRGSSWGQDALRRTIYLSIRLLTEQKGKRRGTTSFLFEEGDEPSVQASLRPSWGCCHLGSFDEL